MSSVIRLVTWPFVTVEQVERGFWTVLAGLASILIGVTHDWFTLPMTLTSGFAGLDTLILVDTEPFAATILRVLLAAVGGLVVAGLIWGKQARFATRWAVWGIFLGLLALPYWLNLWEPDITLDAQLLWSSNQAAIGEQMDTSYDQQQIDYRAAQTIRVNGARMRWVEEPLTLSFPSLPTGGAGMGPAHFGAVIKPMADGLDLSIFRFSRHAEIVSRILGYSNAFLNIAGKGWYFGTLGAFIVLSGFYLHRERGGRSFVCDVRVLAPGVLVLLVFLLAPRLIAEHDINAGYLAAARGDNSVALQRFREAARWKPVLRYELDYESVVGNLTQQRNCNICGDTLLSDADVLMQNGDFPSAIDLLERFRRLNPERSQVRYWLGFAYAQAAIDLFNDGQASAAAADWVTGLSYTPTDANAWYGLALAELRLHDLDTAAKAMRNIVRLEDYFFFKGAPPVAQYYIAESWAALGRGDIDLAHHYYSVSLTPERW